MLNPLKIRLCDEDRAALKQEQEWLPLHAGLLVEVRASLLADWERQTGLKVLDLCQAEFDRTAIVSIRAVAWYARQVAGLAAPAFADFDPLILKVQMEDLVVPSEGDDADPPAPSSADTSAETPPAAKPKASRLRRG